MIPIIEELASWCIIEPNSLHLCKLLKILLNYEFTPFEIEVKWKRIFTNVCDRNCGLNFKDLIL